MEVRERRLVLVYLGIVVLGENFFGKGVLNFKFLVLVFLVFVVGWDIDIVVEC